MPLDDDVLEEIRLSEALPEDFDGRDTLIKNYSDSVPKALSAFSSLRNEMRSTTRVPGEDATPEQWQKYREKIGVPDSPDGYQLPDVEDADLVEQIKELREIAHKNHIPGEAFSSMTESLHRRQAERNAAANQHFTQMTEGWKSELVKELGQEKAEETMALAQRMLTDEMQIQTDDPTEQALMTAIKQHPFTAKLLSKAVQALGPDNIPHGTGGGLTSQEDGAKAQVERFLDLQKTLKDKRTQMLHRERAQKEMLEITKSLISQGYEGVMDDRLR